MINEILDAVINFKQESVDFAVEAELFGDNKEVLRTANIRLEQLESQALTAIYEIGLEVIGEDEPLNIINGENERVWFIRGANELRASQRKAWAKACGVAEK